jgi:predicted metalloprotease
MEWDKFRQSDNVEDRRGDDGGTDGGGGGGGFMPGGGAGGLGLGAIVIIFIVSYFLGIDPRVLINGAQQLNGAHNSYTQQQPSEPQTRPQRQADKGTPQDAMGKFVAAILGETEDTWSRVLPDQKGIQYQPVNLVLYTGRTRSGCGGAQAQMGPFYCPVDKKVYLDLSFFAEMKRKLGGGGDFAYAYVIAHEIGHHVQDQLGILGKVQAAEQRASATDRNAMSVKIELMADCLAGVWAANANKKDNFIQDGDVEKAVNTAKAIGDDTLQQASGREAMPDSFTHGSSAQRMRWLNTGLQTGKIDSCNTFARGQ